MSSLLVLILRTSVNVTQSNSVFFTPLWRDQTNPTGCESMFEILTVENRRGLMIVLPTHFDV